MTPKPGLYPGVPFTEYQQWEAVNDSLLCLLLDRSPAHAKCYRDQPPEPTEALRIGHAFHTRALEPDRFAERYAIRPDCDRRTKAGKATYEVFVNELDGRQELSQAEAESIELMCRSIETMTIHRFIEQGQAEVCVVWTEPATKLLCKARLDYLDADVLGTIVDLKTCMDASKDAFSAAIYRYRYFQKAAWYCDGYEILTGRNVSFVFMAVEKKPPYACAAYQLDDENIIGGRKAYRKALSIYRECLRTDCWPGYPDRVDMLSMPQWALNKVGVGPYNQLTEEDQNGTRDKKCTSGSIETDWTELERDASEAEHHPED